VLADYNFDPALVLLSGSLPLGAVHAMSENLRDLLIAWSLLPFLNPNRTRLLREFFDPLTSVCDASSATLKALLSMDDEQAELVKDPLRPAALERLAAIRDAVLTLVDDDYPPLLREIIDPPLALHVRGRRDLLKRHAIAVVGSRRASPYALNATRHLVAPLAREAELVIVSGLARGVDAAAHQSALDSGGGTIGVLGTGIDVVYPRSNKRLFERMESEALIVSEFPPGTPPLAQNFPIRNRIISGLSRGTVIVEATGRSGSLITARMAAEQGREVFAVPGSIFSAGSEGTHRLIQYGAKLVHDANDVVDELPGYARVRKEEPALPDPPLREVLEALSRDEAVHVDAAAAKIGRSVPSIAESLLQLELGGWVQALPGARYVRVK
jgi:DNA processing protein